MNFYQLKAQDVIYGLAASPNFALDGVCFAARAFGLYRSDNGRDLWQYLYDSFAADSRLTTTAVALSPN